MRVALLPHSAVAERCKLRWLGGPLRQALFLATHPLGGVGSILTELAACKALGKQPRMPGCDACSTAYEIKERRQVLIIARVQRAASVKTSNGFLVQP